MGSFDSIQSRSSAADLLPISSETGADPSSTLAEERPSASSLPEENSEGAELQESARIAAQQLFSSAPQATARSLLTTDPSGELSLELVAQGSFTPELDQRFRDFTTQFRHDFLRVSTLSPEHLTRSHSRLELLTRIRDRLAQHLSAVPMERAHQLRSLLHFDRTILAFRRRFQGQLGESGEGFEERNRGLEANIRRDVELLTTLRGQMARRAARRSAPMTERLACIRLAHEIDVKLGRENETAQDLQRWQNLVGAAGESDLPAEQRFQDLAEILRGLHALRQRGYDERSLDIHSEHSLGWEEVGGGVGAVLAPQLAIPAYALHRVYDAVTENSTETTSRLGVGEAELTEQMRSARDLILEVLPALSQSDSVNFASDLDRLINASAGEAAVSVDSVLGLLSLAGLRASERRPQIQQQGLAALRQAIETAVAEGHLSSELLSDPRYTLNLEAHSDPLAHYVSLENRELHTTEHFNTLSAEDQGRVLNRILQLAQTEGYRQELQGAAPDSLSHPFFQARLELAEGHILQARDHLVTFLRASEGNADEAIRGLREQALTMNRELLHRSLDEMEELNQSLFTQRDENMENLDPGRDLMQRQGLIRELRRLVDAEGSELYTLDQAMARLPIELRQRAAAAERAFREHPEIPAGVAVAIRPVMLMQRGVSSDQVGAIVEGFRAHPERGVEEVPTVEMHGGTLLFRTEPLIEDLPEGGIPLIRVHIGREGGVLNYHHWVYRFPPSDHDHWLLVSNSEVRAPEGEELPPRETEGGAAASHATIRANPTHRDHPAYFRELLQLWEESGQLSDRPLQAILNFAGEASVHRRSRGEGADRRARLELARSLRARDGSYAASAHLLEELMEPEMARIQRYLSPTELEEIEAQVVQSRERIVHEIHQQALHAETRPPQREVDLRIQQALDLERVTLLRRTVFQHLETRITSGRVTDPLIREAWADYNEMEDPLDEWFNLKDVSIDRIIDQVVTEAMMLPLTIISGGVAGLAEGGAELVATSVARSWLSREGVNFLGRRGAMWAGEAGARGIFGRSALRLMGAAAHESGERILARFGVWAAGKAANGAAFELTMRGMQSVLLGQEGLFADPEELARGIGMSIVMMASIDLGNRVWAQAARPLGLAPEEVARMTGIGERELQARRAVNYVGQLSTEAAMFTAVGYANAAIFGGEIPHGELPVQFLENVFTILKLRAGGHLMGVATGHAMEHAQQRLMERVHGDYQAAMAPIREARIAQHREAMDAVLENLTQNGLVDSSSPLGRTIRSALEQSVAATGNDRIARYFMTRAGRRALFAAVEALRGRATDLARGSRADEMSLAAVLMHSISGVETPAEVGRRLRRYASQLRNIAEPLSRLADRIARSLREGAEPGDPEISPEMRERIHAQLIEKALREGMSERQARELLADVEAGRREFYGELNAVTGEFYWDFRTREERERMEASVEAARDSASIRALGDGSTVSVMEEAAVPREVAEPISVISSDVVYAAELVHPSHAASSPLPSRERARERGTDEESPLPAFVHSFDKGLRPSSDEGLRTGSLPSQRDSFGTGERENRPAFLEHNTRLHALARSFRVDSVPFVSEFLSLAFDPHFSERMAFIEGVLPLVDEHLDRQAVASGNFSELRTELFRDLLNGEEVDLSIIFERVRQQVQELRASGGAEPATLSEVASRERREARDSRWHDYSARFVSPAHAPVPAPLARLPHFTDESADRDSFLEAEYETLKPIDAETDGNSGSGAWGGDAQGFMQSTYEESSEQDADSEMDSEADSISPLELAARSGFASVPEKFWRDMGRLFLAAAPAAVGMATLLTSETAHATHQVSENAGPGVTGILAGIAAALGAGVLGMAVRGGGKGDDETERQKRILNLLEKIEKTDIEQLSKEDAQSLLKEMSAREGLLGSNSVEDPESRRRRQEEVQLAREALSERLQTGTGRGAFAPGGTQFHPLKGALFNQVVAWPQHFSISHLAADFDAVMEGELVRDLEWQRFTPIRHLVAALENGYDPHRPTPMDLDGMVVSGGVDAYREHYGSDTPQEITAGYFFHSQVTDEESYLFSQLLYYGLPNIQGGLIASIHHIFPLDLALLLYAAGNGRIYNAGGEAAVFNEGITQLNEVIQGSSEVETVVVFHAFRDTPEAHQYLDRILRSGVKVHFDLGQRLWLERINPALHQDIQGDALYQFQCLAEDFTKNPKASPLESSRFLIENPDRLATGTVGTDHINEESLHFLLLFLPPQGAMPLIEKMLRQNEEMAERASSLYASMPGYTVPILSHWLKAKGLSRQLRDYLQNTLQRAEELARRYLGKILVADSADSNGNIDGDAIAALLAVGAGAATLLATDVAHAAHQVVENSGPGVTGILAGIAAALGAGVLGMALGRPKKKKSKTVDAIGETEAATESSTEDISVSEIDSAETDPHLGGTEDLERSALRLQDQLIVVENEVSRLRRRLAAIEGQLEVEVWAAYRREIEEINRRMEFWLKQQSLAEKEPPTLRERFEQDIEIGQRLLLDRSLRLEALVFAELLDPGSLSSSGLRSPWRIPHGPRPVAPTPPGASPASSRILPALVNSDIGFGGSLALRPHQLQALQAIRGWMRSHLDRLQSGESLSSDFLQAAVVMPVGGGKTRLMVASFAEAMSQGIFSADRGDKFILLNHTDRIHEQNLREMKRLGAYFKKKFDRALRVSEYKAGQKDLSGDVIVVSIPTVNNEERREAFAQELRRALGEQGGVTMVAIDEVHHLELGRASGRESWTELVESLRQISPQFLRLGFTATPTGREGRVLSRFRELDLMRAGVTPRTYLVKVEGEDLSKLKVTEGIGDFATRELSSTLLQYPRRNERIYASLEQNGLRYREASPSGRESLEGTIVFAADLAHAGMMARGYREYFGGGEGDPTSFRNRRIQLLGENRGKLSRRDFEAALDAYRQGKIDAIAVVLSGETSVQREILEAVERGEIEAVFTVDALVEGADLYMFRNQVGARPTFSRIKRGQERGRINRRGPREVSPTGELLQDPPRLLFDVLDRYHSLDRALVRYGDVMGLRGHVSLTEGQLFDAMSESMAEAINRDGRGIVRPSLDELDEHRKRLPSFPNPTEPSAWSPLIQIMSDLIHHQYHGHLDDMALDLGMSPEFIETLLKGENWRENAWFLRRMATLLYQGRETLVRVVRRIFHPEWKGRYFIYRARMLQAFRTMLTQIEAEGRKISFQRAADLAHKIYCEGCLETSQPSRETFRSYISKIKDSEILSLLKSSELIQSPKKVKVDRALLLKAFGTALSQAGAKGKQLTPHAVAILAHDIYCQGLPEDHQPNDKAFIRYLDIRDAEIQNLLQSSGIIGRRMTIKLDRIRVLDSFRQARSQVDAEGRTRSPHALADLAHAIYCQGLPEGSLPSKSTFRHYILIDGKAGLAPLLESSGIIKKQTQVKLNRERLFEAFQAALSQAEVEGKRLTRHALARMAHEIYCRGLSTEAQPSVEIFDAHLQGRIKSRILPIMDSPIIFDSRRRRPVELDHGRMLLGFKTALSRAEGEGRKLTYQAWAYLAHEIYCEGLPEGSRPHKDTFRSYVSRLDSDIHSLIESTGVIEKGKRFGADEGTGGKQDPDGSANSQQKGRGNPEGGAIATLLAVGAGAAALFATDVAHAAHQVMESSGPGVTGILAGIAAALGAGIFGMVLGRPKKKKSQPIDAISETDSIGEISEEEAEEAEVVHDLGGTEDLEASPLRLQDHLITVETEMLRLKRRLVELEAQLDAEVLRAYRGQVEEIHRRTSFWLEQQTLAEQETPFRRERFFHDIEIGQGLLLDRVIRLAALIFAEPLDPSSLSSAGLRSPWRIPHGPSAPRPIGPEVLPGSEKILPSLVNRDVGFGRDLSLRAHQEQGLSAIRGWIRSHLDRVQSGESPIQEFLQASIVMPVGGGKTRMMVASFAEAISQGLFLVNRGDKFIVLNHTNRIHEQNLREMARLGDYFRKKYGRSLRISEYKAEKKDLSGDVVVLSVPTVNNAERRQVFSAELKQTLGSVGRLAMVAIDEVHHLELGRAQSRESWTELVETLREVSPHFLRLGFTATPTGREGRVLCRIRELDLMRAGVTPRTYLVKVEGEDLSQLKIAEGSGDFATRELSSTLLKHPRRNERIFSELELHGLRQDSNSPSGRERLEGTIVFAAELAHAQMMAEGYRDFFGRTEEASLRGRRIQLLGQNRGKISRGDLDLALKELHEARIDAIVAVISGETSVQREILAAVEAGEIEAIFTVDVLVEGADLYMFRNQIGARPTFSRIKRGQERGRINRRGPTEVSHRGELLRDPPRILFDVIDRYHSHDRALVRYGDVMGVRGHVQLSENQLFDAMSESTVETVNHDGQGLHRPSLEKLNEVRDRPRVLPTIRESTVWAPLIQITSELIDNQYQGHLDDMALDLGMAPEFIESLLQGEGWRENPWFLRRLGTLLYQGRERLLNISRRIFYPDYAPRQRFEHPRLLQAIRDALSRAEAEGKRLTYQGIADRAYSFYCEGLAKEKQPSQQSFRHRVAGRNAIAEIRALLESSSIVERQNKVESLDRDRVLQSFRDALARAEAGGMRLTYQGAANLAHTFYCKGLAKEKQPSQITFIHRISGKKPDAELLALLQVSPTVEKKDRRELLDRVRLLQSFRDALARAEAEGNRLTYQGAAKLAHFFYCKALSEDQRPSLETFRHLVAGKKAIAEILALLESSSIVERQNRESLNRVRLLQSFRDALARAEVEGKQLTYRGVADLAHALYCEGLLDAERPSRETFRGKVNSNRGDAEIVALLESSEIAGRRARVEIDRGKLLRAFRDALVRAQAEGMRLSYIGVADLAHEIFCEGLPEARRPSRGTFRYYVTGGDIEIRSLLEASPVAERWKLFKEDPDGNAGGAMAALLAVGAGAAALIATDVAHAAHQVSESAGPGVTGILAGIAAALGAGVLGMAFSKESKREAFESKYAPQGESSLIGLRKFWGSDKQPHAGNALETYRRQDPTYWRKLLADHFSGSEEEFWRVLDELVANPELADLMWCHCSASASLALLSQTNHSLLPSGRLVQQGVVPFSGELSLGVVHRKGINQREISGFAAWDVGKAIQYLDQDRQGPWRWEGDIAFINTLFSHLDELSASEADRITVLDVVALRFRRLRAWDLERFRNEFPYWRRLLQILAQKFASIQPNFSKAVRAFLKDLVRPTTLILHESERDWILQNFPMVYASTNLPSRRLKVRFSPYQEYGAREVSDPVTGETYSVATLGQDIQYLFVPAKNRDSVAQWLTDQGLHSQVRVRDIRVLRILGWILRERSFTATVKTGENYWHQLFREIQEYAQDSRTIRVVDSTEHGGSGSGAGGAIAALLAVGAGAATLLGTEVAHASTQITEAVSQGAPALLTAIAAIVGAGAIGAMLEGERRMTSEEFAEHQRILQQVRELQQAMVALDPRSYEYQELLFHCARHLFQLHDHLGARLPEGWEEGWDAAVFETMNQVLDHFLSFALGRTGDLEMADYAQRRNEALKDAFSIVLHLSAQLQSPGASEWEGVQKKIVQLIRTNLGEFRSRPTVKAYAVGLLQQIHSHLRSEQPLYGIVDDLMRELETTWFQQHRSEVLGVAATGLFAGVAILTGHVSWEAAAGAVVLGRMVRLGDRLLRFGPKQAFHEAYIQPFENLGRIVPLLKPPTTARPPDSSAPAPPPEELISDAQPENLPEPVQQVRVEADQEIVGSAADSEEELEAEIDNSEELRRKSGSR